MLLHSLTRLAAPLGRMRLRTKLLSSFAVIACTTLLTGTIGWGVANRLSSHLVDIGTVRLAGIENILRVSANLETIKSSAMILLDPGITQQERLAQYQAIAQAQKAYEQELHTCDGLPRTDREAALHRQLRAALAAWETENRAFLGLCRELDVLDIGNPLTMKTEVEQFRGDLYKLQGQTSYLIQTNTSFDGGDNPRQSHFGRWLDRFTTANHTLQQIVKAIVPEHEKFYAGVADIKKQVTLGRMQDASLVFFSELMPAADTMFGLFDKLRLQAAKAEELYTRMAIQARVTIFQRQRAVQDILEELITLNEQAAAAAVAQSLQSAQWARTNALVGCALGALFSLLLGTLLSLHINGSLTQTISGLRLSSQTLRDTSLAMSANSADLHRAAEIQASRLQESSAALEQITHSTRSNADSSTAASRTARLAHESSEQGAEQMRSLLEVMHRIETSASQCASIVETINGLAFQTKMLSLNAAIEATHAGEAGNGFAVVAREVGLLAQQCAESAKNTASLIHQALGHVSSGVQASQAAAAVFDELARAIGDIRGLNDSVSAATIEQATAIEQLYGSVADMQTATESSTHRARETAETGEVLSNHALDLNELVAVLHTVVHGSDINTAAGARLDSPQNRRKALSPRTCAEIVTA